MLLQIANLWLQECYKVWIEAVDCVSFITFSHWSNVYFSLKKKQRKPCIQCIDWNKPMNSYNKLLKKWWCEVLQVHCNLWYTEQYLTQLNFPLDVLRPLWSKCTSETPRSQWLHLILYAKFVITCWGWWTQCGPSMSIKPRKYQNILLMS